MIRKIIKIDEKKCNGCSLCVSSCHEGAIIMVDGKAKLLRDDYCDGLGNCLPVCPTGAITFEEREAKAFDKEAVEINIKNKQSKTLGCPGINSKSINHTTNSKKEQKTYVETHLNQWPVQIKLVPPNASYFNNTHLLIASDCTAFAYGNFHADFMQNRITLIGCPKLDNEDYSEKLTTILKINNINSVIVARMEVPCCIGIEKAVETAIKNCGKNIEFQVIVISINGKILNKE